MENSTYLQLHNLIKVTNRDLLTLAVPDGQVAFYGHALSNSGEKFRIVQNRKGHKNKNNLTYVLFHKQTEIMIRIDLHGAAHHGLSTQQVHIFEVQHQNGNKSIPLANLEDYDLSDDIMESLLAFLTYNQFETQNNYFTK